MKSLKLIVLLAISWSVMTFLHESGHIVAGWYAGGRLVEADLFPWKLPYSLFEPDPQPLLRLWGGPILGSLIPIAFGVIVRNHSVWFVSYFCLLANGVYLALAWIDGSKWLDTPELLEHGAPRWSILLFCALTISFGYLGFRREVLNVLFGGEPKRESLVEMELEEKVTRENLDRQSEK